MKKKFILNIFNQWDSRVFYSENYQDNWAGDAGVYFYTIVGDDGKVYKGYVTVVK